MTYNVFISHRSPLIFGVNSLPLNMHFGSVKDFTPNLPEAKPLWLQSCVAQVLSVAERKLTDIRWASFKESDGDRYYTPIISRMRRLPSTGQVQHFFDLSNPRSISVTARMIPLANIYRKRLNDVTRNMKLASVRSK